MFGVLPERIALDPWLAAGARLRGRVAISALERLADCLRVEQSAECSAEADLSLAQDPQGRYWLQGRIQALLTLRCERCQGLLEWPVSAALDGLYLVASEAAAAGLAEDAEYVIAEDCLCLHDLVEDELILALPLVARHPAGTECGDRSRQGPMAESGERDSPFAILKTLKT